MADNTDNRVVFEFEYLTEADPAMESFGGALTIQMPAKFLAGNAAGDFRGCTFDELDKGSMEFAAAGIKAAFGVSAS